MVEHLYTYFLPEMVAKCGVCPYAGPKDDHRTRELWLELNNAQSIHASNVERFVHHSEIDRISGLISQHCESLTNHLNAINTRFLDHPQSTTFEFSKSEITELVSSLVPPPSVEVDPKLITIINESGLKTSQAFLDILPPIVSRSIAAVSSTGVISFSWLKEIDELSNVIKNLKQMRKDEALFIEKTIKAAQKDANKRSAGNQLLGRFTTQKWNAMTQKIQCDRILYYSHLFVHAHPDTSPSSFTYYQEIMEKMNSSPKTKIKWNSKIGIIESIDFGPTVSAATSTRKRKRITKTEDDDVKNRQLELCILYLLTPEIFNLLEKNSSINVTLLAQYIIKACRNDIPEYTHHQSVVELVTKAVTMLNEIL